MKTIIKKGFAVLLALVMLLAICATASAADGISRKVKVLWDGEDLCANLSVKPIIKGNRCLVPDVFFNEVAKKRGCTSEVASLDGNFYYFDAEKNTICAFPDPKGDGDCGFLFSLDRAALCASYSDGTEKWSDLEVGAMKLDGHYYIPLRAWAEQCDGGGNVTIVWDEATRTVKATDTASSAAPAPTPAVPETPTVPETPATPENDDPLSDLGNPAPSPEEPINPENAAETKD